MGLPDEKINEAYETLREMSELGFIGATPISQRLDEAKELEIRLRLYASDAVNLAPTLLNSIDILTEDRHLLRSSVKNFMEERGIKSYNSKNSTKTLTNRDED